jgi:hypothetical protein
MGACGEWLASVDDIIFGVGGNIRKFDPAGGSRLLRTCI